MKLYQLASPEQMREAILRMKDEHEAQSASSIATVWSVATRQGNPNAFKVYIKVGRTATLCREREGCEISLGDMRLKEARELIAGTKLCEGGV